MMCQCRFTSGDTGASLLPGVDSGGVRSEGTWARSLPSPQFFREPQIALKRMRSLKDPKKDHLGLQKFLTKSPKFLIAILLMSLAQ